MNLRFELAKHFILKIKEQLILRSLVFIKCFVISITGEFI